ncbi:MAG TPA: hypothetical protein V6C57_08860 [Coleofasciculaceae cyanobacterium]
MGVERYWQFIRVDAGGQRKVEESAIAKAFFKQQFPNVDSLTDDSIQRQLCHWMGLPVSEPATLQEDNQETSQQTSQQTSQEIKQCAEQCLRCFISNQIDFVCGELETQFGARAGFTRFDLLPFVLDDVLFNRNRSPASGYEFLSDKILRTFDPAQSKLATWTKRLVISHSALNQFLLECGVYLASDWSILNKTSPGTLQRLFCEVYVLTPSEVQRACDLLDSYRAIYQAQLPQRRATARGKCPVPTDEQLQQMGQRLSPPLPPVQVLHKLQALAQMIRDARKPHSLDVPDTQAIAIQQPVPASEEDEEHIEFLTRYRQKFLSTLDQAIAETVSHRVTELQRKKPPKDAAFLLGLQLFYCQGKPMREIAPAVNLQQQYQVTRLLDRKQLEADIRHASLLELRHRVEELAKYYVDLTQLETLDAKLDAALQAHLDEIFTASANAASIGNRPLDSIFFRQLCHYLDHRSAQS